MTTRTTLRPVFQTLSARVSPTQALWRRSASQSARSGATQHAHVVQPAGSQGYKSYGSSSTSSSSSTASRKKALPLSIALLVGGLSYFHLTERLRVLHTEAAPSASLLPPKEQQLHKDPSTSLELPYRIPVPISISQRTGDETRPFVLVASGVRTVSFLRVQVYVAALYVEESSFAKFASSSAASSGAQTAEDLMNRAIESGVAAVVRIVPVRNTDFAHLRDGFTRAIQQRRKNQRKAASEEQRSQSAEDQEAVEEALAEATQRFKESFPKTSLKKGEELDIVLRSTSAGGGVDVALEHKGEILGRVPYDPRGRNVDIARLLLGAYLAEKDPVSAVFKKAVADKLLGPVNTPK